MSYILDALKKSEQKRKQGEVPDLPSSSPGGRGPKPKRPMWTIVLVIALLANAALLAWWLLRDGDTPPDEIRVVASSPRPAIPVPAKRVEPPRISENGPVAPPPSPAKSSGETPSTDFPVPDNVASGQRGKPSETVRPAPSANPLASASIPSPQEASPPPPSPGSTPAEPSRPPLKADEPGMEGKKDLYDLEELPGRVRRLVPDMEVTLHFYTENEAARMVRINGMNLREGFAVSKDVSVDKITPEGIIFLAEGYRFQIRDLSVGR